MSRHADSTTVDAREVALALGRKPRSVQEQAARQHWPYREVCVRGGRQRRYIVDELPAEVGARVIVWLAQHGRYEAPSNTLRTTPDTGLCAEPAGVVSPSATPPLGAAPAATGAGGLGAVASVAIAGVSSAPRGALPAAAAAGFLQPSGEAANAAANDTPTELQRAAEAVQRQREILWAWYARRPASVRDEAVRRSALCREVRALIDGGLPARHALAQVAACHDTPEATLRRWWYGQDRLPGVARAHPGDYAPLLAPRHEGGAQRAELHPDAWAWIKADWLRVEQPTLRACYRRLLRIAAEQGWTAPSLATVQRRIDALPWQVKVLAREGMQALLKRLPHVKRTRGHLHAMQAVNADGHVFDLMVKLPSGTVGRPVMVAWQDLMSGKILAWRKGETINQHIVRLAFGDMVEKYGVPEDAYLDNGREFANKWMTGGAATRFRFKILDDDPLGIFALMGIQTHWTTPYHGQSKPIERAFRDLCDTIARHPAAAGCWTGNHPLAKPENYGSRALEWDAFCRLVDEGIAEHNARPGRRSETAAGRSLDDTFAASLRASAVRRATPEQRRLWLMAADGVTVRGTGHVAIAGNLYWGEDVAAHAGRKLVVRFDPDRLDAPVHAYTPGGEYVGQAERSVARFDDMDAAREHARANRQRLRAARELLSAERRMTAIEAAQMLCGVLPPQTPEPGAVRLMPGDAPRRRATGTDGAAPQGELPAAQQRLVSGADAVVLQWMNAQPRRAAEEGD